MQCTIVTPDRTVHDDDADFVAVTLYDGEAGIGPSRAPMIGRLGYGELRITLAGQVERYYVEGGFVEVRDDNVSVLTERAVHSTEIELAVAREQLMAAQASPITSPEQAAIRERAISQARAQLLVARRADGPLMAD